MKQNAANSLASELARLQTLNRKELMAEWQQKLGREAPRRISQKLLLLAFAYRLQEKVYGGLKPHIKAELHRIANSTAQIKPLQQIKAGTRLIREWHGITHEVLILDDGVQYKDQKYHSLSEVAQAITGTKWSGPAFFGLKARKK